MARMPAATTPKRHDKFEAAWQSRTSISVPRKYWQAVHVACKAAVSARPDNGDWSFVPAFLRKLEEALKAHSPKKPTGFGNWLDPECIAVEGRVCNWKALCDIVLSYGDDFARGVGIVMSTACSQIVFGFGRQIEGAGDGS